MSSSNNQSMFLSASGPSPVSYQRIIPEEDPQRRVDVLDGEDESDGVGDGIGIEDDDMTEDDEPENELDTGAYSQRPLPPWLLSPFLEKIEESKRRNDDDLPPLYAASGTFWFPQKSIPFILQQMHILPSDLYNPSFFLWDPKAICKVIPCPNCKSPLQCHGNISRPRRVIDIDSTFWIIGYRYRCYKCIHPKSKKRTVTFQSWDERILCMLPPMLSLEFPAHFSHRSGVSNAVFSWMRSCMQSGMGSKQFSDALRVQHLLAYDQLQTQYLEHILLRRNSLDAWTGVSYKSFLPFDDTSPSGRHGYIPNAQWFAHMYDSYIEKHRDYFNQHTAMLSCEIGAIDHSHKVCLAYLHVIFSH